MPILYALHIVCVMDLRRLRYFVSVAEEMNFSRAAQKLHIAQPPLSMQIRNLEIELGVPLFERRERPIRLTAAGTSLLEDARKILSDVKGAELRAQNAGRGVLGHLAIGYIAPLANDLLASILQEFRLRFPKVDVVLSEMTSPVQINALLEQRLDIGFLRPILASRVLHFEKLFSDRMVLAAPSGHPLCRKERIRWSDLHDVPLILLNPLTAAGLYNDFLAKCQRSVPNLSEHQIANDIHTALWLVSAGFGVSPAMSFLRSVARANLSFLDLPPDAPLVQVVMARRVDSISPAVSNFIETAKGFLKKTRP
ncbi:MAG: LysR substrate-binding domain-containing protein [Terrimicrobiaceae bacterium]